MATTIMKELVKMMKIIRTGSALSFIKGRSNKELFG
jgi:hypothetical protein